MSIMDTIADTLKGKPDDEAIQAAIATREALEKKKAEFESDFLTLVKKRDEAERRLRQIRSDAFDDPEVKPLVAEAKSVVNSLTEELADIEGDQQALAEKICEAKIAYNKAIAAGTARTIERLARLREKHATACEEAIAAFAKNFAHVFDDNTKIRLAMPDGIQPPMGSMCSNSEWIREIQVALYKALPHQAGMANPHPPLPGSANGSLLGDPKKLPSLTDKIAEANSFLIRSVDGSVPEPVAAPPEMNFTAYDEEATLVVRVPAPQQTHTAASVMASMKKRTLEIPS